LKGRSLPQEAGGPGRGSAGETPKAVFAGLLLTLFSIYWITISEVRWYTLDGTSLPLFIQLFIHPMGYALALSYAMDYFWFAFLFGWLIKLTLVRWGGMRTHTAAAPFFLGLIMGDYLAGSVWSLYGCLMEMRTYKMFI
jgi:hypothetical protein